MVPNAKQQEECNLNELVHHDAMSQVMILQKKGLCSCPLTTFIRKDEQVCKY
jgi:hypothetical protein